jgi:hypothetical protein
MMSENIVYLGLQLDFGTCFWVFEVFGLLNISRGCKLDIY